MRFKLLWSLTIVNRWGLDLCDQKASDYGVGRKNNDKRTIGSFTSPEERMVSIIEIKTMVTDVKRLRD